MQQKRLGVIAEFYPTAQTILRFDVGQLLTRYGNATLATFPNGLSLVRAGRITSPLHVEVGAGYRLGAVHREADQPVVVMRFGAGAEYALFTSNRGLDQIVRDESGLGGWFTWNFNKFVSFDSATTFFPRKIHIADFQQGGKILQGVFGLRAGIRRGYIGVFGKFRPGIQRYSVTSRNSQTQQLSPFADIALDIGGIVEIYTGRRGIVRFDAGNTSIYFRPRDVIGAQGQPISAPGFVNSTIQLSTGVGFRF